MLFLFLYFLSPNASGLSYYYQKIKTFRNNVKMCNNEEDQFFLVFSE